MFTLKVLINVAYRPRYEFLFVPYNNLIFFIEISIQVTTISNLIFLFQISIQNDFYLLGTYQSIREHQFLKSTSPTPFFLYLKPNSPTQMSHTNSQSQRHTFRLRVIPHQNILIHVGRHSLNSLHDLTEIKRVHRVSLPHVLQSLHVALSKVLVNLVQQTVVADQYAIQTFQLVFELGVP